MQKAPPDRADHRALTGPIGYVNAVYSESMVVDSAFAAPVYYGHGAPHAQLARVEVATCPRGSSLFHLSRSAFRCQRRRDGSSFLTVTLAYLPLVRQHGIRELP